MKMLLLFCVMLICLAGCAKKPVPKLPPVPLVSPAARTAPPPADLPAPPQIATGELPALPPISAPMPNAPKPQVPARPRIVQKKEAPKPIAPKPTGPGFQLGEVLTASQQAELSVQIDSFMRSAEQAVRMASARVLNPDQSNLLSQLRIIVDQARKARLADLVEARKLAERARNLAEALVRSGL